MATNPHSTAASNETPCRLSGDESTRMNERIRELRGQGVPGPHIPSILNQEFGVQFPPAAYRARAAHLHLTWKGARATGKESEQISARLKQLVAAGVCGKDIVATLNREFQRDLSAFAYYARARKLGLKVLRGRPCPSRRRESVPPEKRDACLQDPAWEARNNIVDRTACKECFYLYVGPLTFHLKASHEGMHWRKYRQLHPCARLFSFKKVAADTGRDCQELMREFADSYATPEDRASAVAEGWKFYRQRGITTYTICCVERCGFKATELGRHLRNVHRMSTRQYWAEYGVLPITAEASLARARAKGKARKDELERLRAMASGRPKRKPGPQPSPEHTKTFYIVGWDVESRIPANLKNDWKALANARQDVAFERRMQISTVRQHHKKFRKLTRQ